MNNQVWMLYGTGIPKSELFDVGVPPDYELLGIYSDYQALVDDNALFMDHEITDGCVIAGIDEAVEMGDMWLLAIGAYPITLNEEIQAPQYFHAGMIVCASYCFCKVRGELNAT